LRTAPAFTNGAVVRAEARRQRRAHEQAVGLRHVVVGGDREAVVEQVEVDPRVGLGVLLPADVGVAERALDRARLHLLVDAERVAGAVEAEAARDHAGGVLVVLEVLVAERAVARAQLEEVEPAPSAERLKKPSSLATQPTDPEPKVP
jgi:hypothetical protein